ncbi:uncharacterized protein LOC112051073 [Bicyclus anynana]|uniref:Uncharacterized protein LOC112051073 n=1 Tax=Bicyclus anynana TaxID=110368 RepID=A0A6J1NJZ4_BICAN|nr:uncharacterized protein LOC112051073 [Bicyclus anynana]
MDLKELGTKSPVSTSISDGGTKFALNSPTIQSSRNKSFDVGSNTLGKVDATASRPCAIIGPDRVLPNPDDTMYTKKVPGEGWPPESIYRRPPEYPSKISDCQPTRNISPRQTFQENMQRIMVPPTFSSIKSGDETSLKNTKHNMPQEAKYCEVPYNVNTVNSEHKSVRNSDIPMSNVNPYARNMPPPYGWPAGVNVRPLRPYGAPEFYHYQEYPSCAGPRPMTMIRPHRSLHEESAQVYSERLYQDANIRFKPYPTGKEKHQQSRYDYVNNYPSTFHSPSTIPPHKYDMTQKPIHGHPYPVYPPPHPFKYLDRRIHDPFADGYHRSHNQQVNFNAFHNQIVPPPYGPIPGTRDHCMQNKSYSEHLSKPINANKIQFENNNKVYLNLEPRNKNYPIPENLYYNEMNHQSMRGEVLLPNHSTLPIHPRSQHSIYRKDNIPVKSYDYNPNYRGLDHVNHSLQRIPLHFSPNTISPSDSNTSNDTAHTIGTSHEDCGYVSQSSTTSIRSIDSGNIPHDIYRRPSYNNYDMFQNTFHSNGPIQTPKSKNSSSNKKNLNVRQFLQMWNEGDEEVSDGSKEIAVQNHVKKLSQNEITNQEQLYVLGLVNVPNEELGKYDHIQKISKLPENIKGYNNLEILNQYEELLETPHINNYNKSRNYNNSLSKSLMDKELTTNLPRPVSPLDVEAKISQSVIHKEVGCNFEIKPCSPKMLNVEIAAPVQNLLGERIIEKVINPIGTKTPNLTRSNNNKLQNVVNDVASCKMISDQYSMKSLPNTLNPSSYAVQDMESNTGLCLSSLPQLDNDIELNFPEINQQFIKANQMETNNIPGVPNILHTEIKDDSRQSNLSPHLSLCSVGDKESSKLSKFRKCKKAEVSTLPKISQQSTVKSSEPIAALQRIDSVIIKNPDTVKSQYNDCVKISSGQADEIQTESKQCFKQYERYFDSCDLSSETAIDFSLNRSEDETAVVYLNSINKNTNQILPPLEAFDEETFNKKNNVLIATDTTEIQNRSENHKIVSPKEVINELQGEHLDIKITKECGDKKQNKSQEIEKNKYGLLKSPGKSPNVDENQEFNVLVMKNLGDSEISAKCLTSTGSTTNVESPVVDIAILNSLNKKSSKDISFLNPTDIVVSKYTTDVEKVVPESNEENQKGVEVQDSKEFVKDDKEQQNYEESSIDIDNKMDSNVISDISIDVKTENTYNFENSDKENVAKKQISGEMLENSFTQDYDDLNNIINKAVSDTEDFIVPDDSQKNKEDADNKSDVSPVRSHSGNIKDVDYREVDNLATSEPNAKNIVYVNKEKLSEVKCNEDVITTSDIMCSTSERISSIETETNLTALAVEISEYTLQSKTKTEMAADLSDKNIRKCNVDDSIITFSETLEIAHSDCASKLNVCDFECLSKEYDIKTCDLKNETSNVQNKSESIISSTVEPIKCGEIIDTLSTAKLQEKNDKSNIMCMDASESSSAKADTVDVLCSFVNKTLPETPNAKITKCKSEMEIEEHNIEYETNVIKSNCLTNKSCLEDNSTKEICLFTKNIICPENIAVKNADTEYETEMNIADSGKMSHETNDLFPVERDEGSYLISNDKIISEKSIDNIIENDNEIKINDKSNVIKSNCLTNKSCIQAGYVTNVGITECVSNPITKIEESILTITTKTSLENSTVKPVEYAEITDRKDNDLNIVSELDITDIDYCSNVHLEQNSCTSFEGETYESLRETQQNHVIKKDQVYCHKELFSPWIQKLIMFTEGDCILDRSKNFSQENNNVSFVDTTVLSKNDNLLLSWDNEDNYEMCDKESNLIYLHDIPVSNCTLQSEQSNSHVIQLDNNRVNRNHETKTENRRLTPVANNNSYIIKPRKISKRSLSESAIEAFQYNDDENYVHPCKRKKGINGNQSFLEPQRITEDICNIIQTNRRNSIATFYNEDNVYIVIDNDLILAEENEDSDKLCYTEGTEEYLTSLEASNEINLNLETDLFTDEPNQISEEPDSVPHIQEKCFEDSWVDDVACIETVFSEDVAENIVIDLPASPKQADSLDSDIEDEESAILCDNDHIDKIKSIYGRNMCNDNTQLIETLYRTPQMDVNKTLYHIESKDCLDEIIESCLQSTEIAKSESSSILKSNISSSKVVDNKERLLENVPCNYNIYKQNLYSDLATEEENILTKESIQDIYSNNDFKLKCFPTKELSDRSTIHSNESSNDYITMNNQKENSRYSCSSSPEVSSTTSEENNSSILLKITNCNGSRVSQINEITTDSQNKVSYKLTEKGEYRSFNSSRKLMTKAAQKYIPPLKETIYDLKIKLPLPQHRLHTLKQLKIAKVEQKVDVPSNVCTVKRLNYDISKKPKPKFEDVLKSIDEINFKRHKDNVKKGKIAIPKVIIKKNEDGAHYASSKTLHRKETYNPDLTGRKWQPWVFLEKNNFVDRMALQNKVKAVFCHRKNSYVLLEKFRKYKSIYNANFIITQPKSDTKGNLKYTIRLKPIH